jgi:hypothetical protein
MAKDKKWLFALNTFISSARSDEDALKQIIFHDASLKAYIGAFPADVDYPIWYARFHPLRQTAEGNYTNFYSIEAAQMGQTENVDLQLAGVMGAKGKARDWYNRTAAVYAITNPARMKAIYPNLLKPFYKKGKDDIIAALNTLSKNIGADSNLLMVALKSEVDATFGIISPSRGAQTTAKKTTRISRTTLDKSLRAGLQMQFGDLGLEINKFMIDPDMETLIKSFHDLGVIQQNQQKIFNLTLTSPELKDVATRTMVFNSALRATTTGGDVNIYLASKPGGTDSTPVNVVNGVEKKFTAADFGVADYGVNRYLVVVTASGLKIDFMLQTY